MTETLYQYQYQFGDRPLEGYTIQRAVGRGGFGEVYFAISDSGRQVALKVIQNYEQIELRGIKQCMNLKNPHLVTIFDVKYNDKGRPFVVMEYVSGVSLRDLLDESPGGLGPQKAAFFLQEIAKGLSFLHDCGIVHRDLKPSNIFYENGYVKIGDYGLTKAISAGHASEQTVTVGTVHYMAPEIGQGRYDCGIDIYALGIVLYEMLTGQVPFFGASPAEVLMKHLMDQPNLTGIEEPFARAIKKALVKDPGLRYKTVQEMVEDVFGQDHIRNSVSQFRPNDLSVIAQHVAAKANAQAATEPPTRPSAQALGQTPAQPAAQPSKDKTSGMAQMGEQLGRKIGSAGDQIAEKLAGAASGLERHLSEKASGPDPVSRRQRRILAAVVMAVMSLGISVLEGFNGPSFLAFFLMMAGLTCGILWADRRLLHGLEPGWFRNVVTAGVGILVAALFARISHIHTWTLLSLIVLGFVNWRRLTAPDRRQQIDWTPVVWASVIGALIPLDQGGQPMVSLGVIAGTIIAVQVASPFRSLTAQADQPPSPPQPPPAQSPPPPQPPSPPPPIQAAVAHPETVTRPVPQQAVPVTNLVPEATVSPPGTGASSVAVPVTAPCVSPQTRLVALLLALPVVFPAGMHRIYVGKIGTGIVWFFTGGMLMIGQIVDLVLILAGRFRDKEGRLLHHWTRPGPGQEATPMCGKSAATVQTSTSQAPEVQVRPPRQRSFFAGLLAFIGYVLLIVGLLIGLAFSLHLPWLVASGVPDQYLAQDLEREFGYADWPALVERIGWIVCAAFLLLAMIFLLLARRRHGIVHLIRAVTGVVLLTASLACLYYALPGREVYLSNAFRSQVAENRVAAVLDQVLGASQIPYVIGFVAALIAGVTVMAWPAGQPRLDRTSTECGKGVV